MFSAHKPNLRRRYRRRSPSLEVLVFKMGGVSGAVRRIIRSWRFPFRINQLKIELRRRHPDLIPGDGQVEAAIEEMVSRKQLSAVDDGQYQQSEFVEEAA